MTEAIAVAPAFPLSLVHTVLLCFVQTLRSKIAQLSKRNEDSEATNAQLRGAIARLQAEVRHSRMGDGQSKRQRCNQRSLVVLHFSNYTLSLSSSSDPQPE